MTARRNKGSVLSTTSSLGEEKKAITADSQADASAGCSSFSLTTPKGTNVDVKTLRDVVNEVPVERVWTVDGIAPDSGLGILGGRHKRGKSTLGMHLSRSVEAGEPFLDRETRKAPVVYVNYEMPLDTSCRSPTSIRFLKPSLLLTDLKRDSSLKRSARLLTQ